MSTLSIDHTSTDPNNYLEHRLQGRDLIIELLDYSIIIRTVQLLNNAVIVVIIDQELDLSQSQTLVAMFPELFPEPERSRNEKQRL